MRASSSDPSVRAPGSPGQARLRAEGTTLTPRWVPRRRPAAATWPTSTEGAGRGTLSTDQRRGPPTGRGGRRTTKGRPAEWPSPATTSITTGMARRLTTVRQGDFTPPTHNDLFLTVRLGNVRFLTAVYLPYSPGGHFQHLNGAEGYANPEVGNF